MAANILDVLKKGKVEYIYHATNYDLSLYINLIRKSPDKNTIIDAILPELIDDYSTFCFNLIYDDDKYEKETKYLLKKGCSFTEDQLINLLFNTNWGVEYIIIHVEKIFNNLSEDKIHLLLNDIFINHQDKIKYFQSHPNTHIRYLFIMNILKYHEDILPTIYPDLIKYLTCYNYQENEQLTFFPLMSIEDICHICRQILNSKYKDQYYEDLKNYILKNYPKNDLAEVFLLKQEIKNQYNNTITLKNNEKCLQELKNDTDNFFSTSRRYKFYIYQHFKEFLSKKIVDDFYSKIAMFQDKDYFALESVFKHELGDKLFLYIDKYLSLSTNSTVKYIDSGTTSSTYRLGDFVLKLVRSKWSYEDIICPDLYLIATNFEEDYVRDKSGAVVSGLEVQKYYKRDAKQIPTIILDEYTKELKRLGYYLTDNLMYGPCGDNCRLLDSYKEAACKNPEQLPCWFKEYPLVLVDRDRVYEIHNKFKKELKCSYY